MSAVALADLDEAERDLDAALGGNDTHMIERASERFRAAVFSVRAVDAWRTSPALARRVADQLARIEMTQQRIKNLTRENRERLAGIDAIRSRAGSHLYGRSGMPTR